MAGAFPPAAAARLRGLPGRGRFEAHLTVDVAGVEQRTGFARTCRTLGVKCVLIELARGAHPSQPMTSSHHHGALAVVLDEIEALYARLDEAGFPIVRVKLEAEVTNAGVPVHTAGEPGTYFEFHAKLWLPASTDLGALQVLCAGAGAHLSRNDHERGAGGVARFVTLRVYAAGRTEATAEWNRLLVQLRAAGHGIAGTKAEYTIYDDRVELDAGWLHA